MIARALSGLSVGKKVLILVVLVVAGGSVLLGLIAFGFIAFVFSVGTAVIEVTVEATVLDRVTKSPIGGCLLTFDLDRITDSRTVEARTDAAGRANYVVSYSTGGALFGLYPRERTPDLRFYLGRPPLFNTYQDIESWDVRFRFKTPWFADVVEPEIAVQRHLAHDEVLNPPPGKQWRPAGFDPIATDPASALLRAQVHFETTADGRSAYRIPLTVLFDPQQAALCQLESLEDVNRRAVAQYNAGKYEEALEEYRKATLRPDAPVWAYRGMGHALGHLGRQKESSDAFRQALDLAPTDREAMYGYANSLITLNDKVAAAQFEKLIALEPDEPRGYIGLANAYFELDRFRETIAAFAQARKLCPTCLNDNDRKIDADAKRLIR